VNKTQAAELKQHSKNAISFASSVTHSAFRAPVGGDARKRLGIRRRRVRHTCLDPHRPNLSFSIRGKLIINTATTIITFLMVFLIQNTQNRDAKAMHLKLDEIIRALKGARNQLVDLEDLSDEDLKKLEEQFQRLRQKAEHGKRSRKVEPAESR